MLKDYPDVMTVRQVADALGIGINKAYELIHSGEIGSKRIGKKIIVPKIYVIDYITEID